ncbi:hypothetical protein D3OALGA1CA_2358 [Olavius algarvensis associated proteobacterium Delta 3]|nr:hypothetical protein D3OALGB2SA_258 [Olavius algarvensis associated proteobacterium Delta 3]CAB5117418.1 hypothetical protein D3OALGA1CA_2358 [Olavius algarvensis associated proteobacterium Delta 3]
MSLRERKKKFLPTILGNSGIFFLFHRVVMSIAAVKMVREHGG